MSGEAMKWVRDQRVRHASVKSLLNVLAARADSGGAVVTSQALLAEDMGCTPRRVRSLLSAMERLGLVSRERRSGGRHGRLSDRIVLPLHRTFDLTRAAVLKGFLSGTGVPVALQSSKRKQSTLPSGTRVPGEISANLSYPRERGDLTGLPCDVWLEQPKPRLAVVGGTAVEVEGGR